MINVLIVDDDPLVRRSLAHLVAADADIAVTGDFESAEQLLGDPAFPDDSSDVALVDLRLPGMSGLSLISHLSDAAPWLASLAVTNVMDPTMVAEVLRAGAVGYLGKNVPPEGLRDAIRAAQRGLIVTSIPQIRAILRRSGAGETAQGLSEEQRVLLEQVANGRTNAEIARDLHYSESAVKHHVSALMRRLGVRNRVELGKAHWSLFH